VSVGTHSFPDLVSCLTEIIMTLGSGMSHLTTTFVAVQKTFVAVAVPQSLKPVKSQTQIADTVRTE
jgi:hypothetical protein